MENRKRIPPRTNIDPKLAEFDDSETSEFVVSRDPSGADETREFVFPHHRVRVEDTSQLSVASDSVTVVSGSDVTTDEDDDIFEPGLLLAARYEITEHVHTGGMGHLYKAKDTRLHGDADGASVAVKVLRQRLMDRPDTRNLLEMEAARARQLSHPNIINVYDFDEHDGQFFLVMEWLEGKSVHELLQQTQGKRLDPSFAWRVIDGAAKALLHAHENGVIHADVNPGNVFICDTQDIKLLDFGVARERSDDDDERERSVWATPAYASPDVLDGRAPVLEDDVFSLACVAYRLLAGHNPFGELTPIEARRRDAEPPAIPGLPDADRRLLETALHFDRPARPGSVAGFLREPGPHGSTVTADAVPATDAAPRKAAAADAPKAPEPSVTWQLGAAAGAGAVAIAGVLLWALWPSDDPTPAATAVRVPAIEPIIETATTEAALAVAIDTDPVADAEVADDGVAGDVEDFAPDDGSAAAETADEPAAATAAAVAAASPDASSAPPVESAEAQSEAVVAEESTASAASAEAGTSASGPVSAEPEPAPPAETQSAGVADSPASPAEPDGAEPAAAETDDAASAAAVVAASVAAAAGTSADIGADALATAESAAEATGDSVPAEPAGAEAPAANESVAAAGDATVDQEAPVEEAATETIIDEPAAGDDAVLARANPAPEAEGPASGAKVDEPPEKAQVVPLSQLGLERYVEPRYPRAARLRDQAGFVDVRFNVYPNGTTGDIVTMQSSPDDVFVRSAEEAVSRWRFARRDDTVLAQVRLTFNPNQ